jgi:antitoxin HicB
MNYRYSILIQWSEEDQLYLVMIPEFVDRVMQPCTSGKTYEEAVTNAQDCIQACLEVWETEGVEPPVPSFLQVA